MLKQKKLKSSDSDSDDEVGYVDHISDSDSDSDDEGEYVDPISDSDDEGEYVDPDSDSDSDDEYEDAYSDSDDEDEYEDAVSYDEEYDHIDDLIQLVDIAVELENQDINEDNYERHIGYFESLSNIFARVPKLFNSVFQRINRGTGFFSEIFSTLASLRLPIDVLTNIFSILRTILDGEEYVEDRIVELLQKLISFIRNRSCRLIEVIESSVLPMLMGVAKRLGNKSVKAVLNIFKSIFNILKEILLGTGRITRSIIDEIFKKLKDLLQYLGSKSRELLDSLFEYIITDLIPILMRNGSILAGYIMRSFLSMLRYLGIKLKNGIIKALLMIFDGIERRVRSGAELGGSLILQGLEILGRVLLQLGVNVGTSTLRILNNLVVMLYEWVESYFTGEQREEGYKTFRSGFIE